MIANGHLLLNGLHAANLVEPENKLDHEFNSKLQLMVDLIVKDWEHKPRTATHNRAQVSRFRYLKMQIEADLYHHLITFQFPFFD